VGFDLYICDENGDDSKAHDACVRVADEMLSHIESAGGIDAVGEDLAEDYPNLDPEKVPLLLMQLTWDRQKATGLYFRASHATWGALVAEMETQGMIALDAIPGVKVSGFEDEERGFDVKADGGYVLLAPSIHPTGVRYEILRTSPLAEIPTFIWEPKPVTGTPYGCGRLRTRSTRCARHPMASETYGSTVPPTRSDNCWRVGSSGTKTMSAAGSET
jgi:hypothetical protein